MYPEGHSNVASCTYSDERYTCCPASGLEFRELIRKLMSHKQTRSWEQALLYVPFISYRPLLKYLFDSCLDTRFLRDDVNTSLFKREPLFRAKSACPLITLVFSRVILKER
jgi:hypothetical protein